MNPRTPFTTIGKNDSRNASAILDSIPRPSQMIRIGATATFGVALTATSEFMIAPPAVVE